MERFLYRVDVTASDRGWWAAVRGEQEVWSAGPFATRDLAHAAVHRLVRRWSVRARVIGGFVWRPRGSEIGVALPRGRAAQGALPFAHAPCSVSHAP